MPVDDCFFFSLAKKWVLITDKRLSQQRPYKHEIKSILTVSTTVTILSFFSTSVSNKQLNRQVEKIGCKNVWSWDLRKWLPLNYDETNDVAIVIRIRKRWNILIGAPVLEQLQFFPPIAHRLFLCLCKWRVLSNGNICFIKRGMGNRKQQNWYIPFSRAIRESKNDANMQIKLGYQLRNSIQSYHSRANVFIKLTDW